MVTNVAASVWQERKEGQIINWDFNNEFQWLGNSVQLFLSIAVTDLFLGSARLTVTNSI